MGCCYSRIEREEFVSRCKARKKYMKHFVKARQAFSASHTMYLRSLRSTGSALLQFASNETNLHIHHHLPPPQPQTPAAPPPPPPPLSSSSEAWTSVTASPALPPPPPPPPSSGWDFWDPFVASSSRSGTEEEWEDTTVASEVAVTVTATTATAATSCMTAPASVVSGFSKGTSETNTTSELAMVVSRNCKDLAEIIKELDEYLLRCADAGGHVSVLLEVPSNGFSAPNKGGKVYSYGWSLSPSSLWSWGSPSPKMSNGEGIMGSIGVAGGCGHGSHCSTAERLYAWEKKLFQEVKNAETLKMEHEKKVAQLRKLELKRADYVKSERTKKVVEKLESQMMVATQAIDTTSEEIVKLREAELYPQLLELVKGLMGMWRSMYESHHVQTHIVQQLKYLSAIPSAQPTSEIHRQATLQLELEVQQWHQSFCNLVKAQRDYIQSLTGWLRLSLFQFNRNPMLKSSQNSRIYKLCEEWHLAMDHIPDKVASEGIKSLLTVIHAIVLQQSEEHKQKKKSEVAFKDLDKKSGQLRSLESKHGPYSTGEKNPVADKRTKVEILKVKAEEEKTKHEKSVHVTRSMTMNNLQMGLPHVFQAMVGFSSVCMHAFESVYNQAKSMDQEHDVKRLLPK